MSRYKSKRLHKGVRDARDAILAAFKAACAGTQWKPGDLAACLESTFSSPQTLPDSQEALLAVAKATVAWLNFRNAMLVVKNQHVSRMQGVAKRKAVAAAKAEMKAAAGDSAVIGTPGNGAAAGAAQLAADNEGFVQ